MDEMINEQIKEITGKKTSTEHDFYLQPSSTRVFTTGWILTICLWALRDFTKHPQQKQDAVAAKGIGRQ